MEESIHACDRIRKLASVQTVSSIIKHPDADRLELATILGWQVVIAKGEVEEGAKVVYCEIDSKLPGDAPWLPAAVKARLENKKNKDFFHVKTACIRGQISQGLIVPMMELEEEEDGYDMTATLGIEKYEEPVFTGKFADKHMGGGGIKGDYPKHLLPKTDEARIQSNPRMLEALQGKPYYATVKLDGSSGTFLIDPITEEFWVCSRNNIRTKPTDDKNLCPYWEAATKANIEGALREHNLTHLAIQGEVCGPKLLKNLLCLDDYEVFVFNLYDLRTKQRLPYEELVSTCATLGLKTVPIESVGDAFGLESIQDVLEAAKGEYESGNVREGLVFRSMDQSISFKAINNEYLLGKKSKKKKKKK